MTFTSRDITINVTKSVRPDDRVKRPNVCGRRRLHLDVSAIVFINRLARRRLDVFHLSAPRASRSVLISCRDTLHPVITSLVYKHSGTCYCHSFKSLVCLRYVSLSAIPASLSITLPQ